MGLIRLDLLSDQPHPSLQSSEDLTWKDFMCDLLHLKRDTSTKTVRATIMQKLQNENQVKTIEK